VPCIVVSVVGDRAAFGCRNAGVRATLPTHQTQSPITSAKQRDGVRRKRVRRQAWRRELPGTIGDLMEQKANTPAHA
jgi:hypothetical protein